MRTLSRAYLPATCITLSFDWITELSFFFLSTATPGSTTTAFPPLTQPPVCSMPEKPAQEADVMGFGHDLYSHVVYNITRYTVLYKLISTRSVLILTHGRAIKGEVPKVPRNH